MIVSHGGKDRLFQFCSHFNAAEPNFPRNKMPSFAQYTYERPEVISHGEKAKKAKTTKGKSKMKRLNNTFGTILLVLGCFAFSSAVNADPSPRPTPPPRPEGPPLVGLWQVHYSSVACDQPVLPPEFFTY